MRVKVIMLIILFSSSLIQCSEKRKKASKEKTVEYAYLKLGSTRASGWLDHVLQSEVTGFSGHLDEFAREVKRKPFVQIDLPEIERGDSWWDGECAGNWRDGLVRLAFTTRDPMLLEKTHTWVREVMEVQQAGDEPYIGIFPKTHPRGNRWESAINELWPQSRAYLAMLAYYEATGDKSVLDAVIKAADLSLEHFFKEREDLDTANFERTLHSLIIPQLNTHSLMIVEPMLQLYEITGEAKYLEFSEFMYDKLQFLNNAILSGTKFIHGVHICENLRVPAMLYACNGNPEMLEISEKGIDLVLNNYVNATGVLRSDEWVSYAKPNRANEYCDITEWVLSMTEMVRITGDMSYADAAEKCFFNAAMGQRLPDGKGIQYLGVPNQLNADYNNDPWSAYGPNHWPLCCNPNATRLFPYFTQRMWMKKGGNGLASVLYGPCEITFIPEGSETEIKITEETRYPFSEVIRFTLACDSPMEIPLTFRIPSWCKAPSMDINGESHEIGMESANTHTVSRSWQTGDEILLRFPMEINVEYNWFSDLVSVMRGPLVYALEIPSKSEAVNEVAPGFFYYNFHPQSGFTWNFALTFDERNPDTAFTYIAREMPVDDSQLWDLPAGKIRTTAQVIDHWYFERSAYKIDQPPVPLSPLYRRFQLRPDRVQTIELVPFGTTRLRITCFPYFINM